MTSIYDQIGGHPALTAVVDDFYRRVLAEPDLAAYFARTDLPRMKRLQVEFFAAVLGGPIAYTGLPLHRVHHTRGITRDHFERTATHLGDALDAAGVRPDMRARVLTVVAALSGNIVSREPLHRVAV
ncbi:group 1 truncated hemoglobin [Nocardia yamanashiensis]|uniref:group I truncated hemoglobin n=1 Tax=Nocardia yamanashiensis TaxID=209247 RepID=UPI001E5AD0F9|nr:group 1 truncated hemoglobin [Nocardia yamanashiensis]UGT44399.1 group 1 truncated hemoglobin [Nocardia yamanashiensis]